mmetsp:Transcript_44085/g.172022  ORF Transcript_44085/g.172022 Transcript_44085/m.172022 type:complete len:92 (-) Transcript_44085:1760-2035(-)
MKKERRSPEFIICRVSRFPALYSLDLTFSRFFAESFAFDKNVLELISLDGAKKYVLQPMLIGFSAAFGMSVGYAFYDYTLSLLKRTKAETS